MSNAILDIAIPTYNRSSSLESLLDVIFPHLSDEVRVLIVDNASSDNTHSVCLQAKANPYVQYYRNSANIGGAPNMLRCFELSDAAFCWLVGDDEALDLSHLKRLLAHLVRSKADAVHVCPSQNSCTKLDGCVDIFFESENDFISEFYSFSDFQVMSSTLVRTEFAKKHLCAAYRLTHLQHAYSYLAYRALTDGNGIELFGMSLFHDKPNSEITRWAVFPAYVDAIESMYMNVSEPLRKQAMSREFLERKDALIYFTLRGLLGQDNVWLNMFDAKRLFGVLNKRDYYLPIMIIAAIFMSKSIVTRRILCGVILGVIAVKFRTLDAVLISKKLKLKAVNNFELCRALYGAISEFSAKRNSENIFRN
jgi:glycosyltransferase involved in cell wall biosynthesis